MPTRLFTSFMIPNNESFVEDKIQYWIDVQEEYDKVFAQIFPLVVPASNLELHECFWYTKVDDGKRFACVPSNIMGIEELD